MSNKIVTTIFTISAIAIFLIIIFTGFFSIWIFVGMFLIGMLYLFGYFYVLNYYKAQEEIDRREQANKKKLDWCWNKANALLQSMAGGQGLSWNRGVGRKSLLKHYHNGIQLCGFRSMEGYLENSQQLVVIIYDIENDDIASYYANPSPDILMDHFANFKPFQSKDSFSGANRYQPYSSRSRYRRPSRGITINTGGDDYDNFDNFSSKSEPTDDVVQDGLKKLKQN